MMFLNLRRENVYLSIILNKNIENVNLEVHQ